MFILRDKNFGYQPMSGITYNSAQVRQNVDDGVVKVADHLDKVVEIAGSTPVIDKASSKWRKRITDYTRPIKSLIRGKKKNKKKC